MTFSNNGSDNNGSDGWWSKLAAGATLSPATERALLAGGVILLFCAGYFGIGLNADSTRARDLATALDRRIPFVAHAVWVYLCVFPIASSPLLFVHSRSQFRRTALAYAGVILISFACFALFPVSSAALRTPSQDLDMARLSDRTVALLYGIDPPYNLLPSLHVSLTVLAVLSMLTSRKVRTLGAVVCVGLIALSACLIKQHFVLDVFAALALGLLVGTVTLLLPRARRG